MSSSKGSWTHATASSAVVAPAKRQKTITSTVEEAGRQAMIESLKRELDKLYRNFDLLIQGSAAIHGFANIMKDLIRNGCLQIAGADALEYTPEPATLQEIVQMFGPSSVKSLRDEAMKEIDNRVMYNFVSMLQEDYAVLWKLKLSVSHAITAWSVWKSDAIYKAIQEATRAELLFVAETVDVRIEEQRAMLTELFIVAGKTITRHKGFETQMVRESVSTNSFCNATRSYPKL
jgi:DnaJ-domain-containing protein 1